jgi:MATE family multidrug resistance protein
VFKPHNQETWPSLAAWREALHWESVRVYFTLGMGGMLATSEWIYWEVISMAIGTLGVVELSIHTVATQAILVTFMIPLGIGIALAIRLGATIIVDVRHAKKLTAAACVSASVLFLCMSIMMYTQRETIFGFFTSDPDVIAGCHKIWPKVCFYFYHLGIYALNMGIATGLGMQWTLGVVTFFFLWIFGLPSALFFGVSVYESLDVVWDLIWPPYMFANVTLVSIFLSKDWNTISRDVRTREGLLEHSDSESDSIEATCYGSLDHSNDAMALL